MHGKELICAEKNINKAKSLLVFSMVLKVIRNQFSK